MDPNPAAKTVRTVCLTGGIATGKTRVSSSFEELGWKSICTDEIVHRLYRPGGKLPQKIADEFGRSVLDAAGGVNRKALAEIVFSEPESLKRLNSIVHPEVREIWRSELARKTQEGFSSIVVIPLAFETEVTKEFNETWVVACSRAQQRARLSARGLQDAEIDQRLAAQLPLQFKIDRAHRVIWNDSTWVRTEEQIKLIHHQDTHTS
jgi:dephospho-CoA kinase